MSKGSRPRPFSVDQQTFGSNYDTIFGKKKLAQTACECYTCTKQQLDNNGVFGLSQFIVCPTCGNKRCPHATDHNLACTNSNASGQPGSRYQ